MIRIAYVLGGLWRRHPGLQSKVLGAAQVWENQGAKVSVVLFSEGRVLDSQGNTISRVSQKRNKQLEAYYDTDLNKLYRFSMVRHQYAFLKEALSSISPDVVYARYALPFPGIKKAFGSSCPYVLEINSDDLTEYGLKNSITGIYNRIFRKGFLRGARGLCFISREMATSSSFAWYQGKTTVVANSIRCDEYPFSKETGNNHINICFIGSPQQSWHGLDKINALICRYSLWKFHIIGPSRQECMRVGIKNSDNVVFHGYLSAKESKQLLSKMDVGISTLALHRKKMNEASPLKSRQYLVQGIPFISAYDDTGIPLIDCVYKLPNTESNVVDNLDTIGSFINQAFQNLILRQEARTFAVANLDSCVVEYKRYEFLLSCL